MAIFELPEGYSEIKRVDLQKDIKLAVIINAAAVVIMILLFFIGTFFVPFSFEISSDNLVLFLLKMLGTVLSMFLYLVAHELVHGIFIKKYSGKRAKYGFTGLYAYAGSDAYFDKRQYIVIALAPVVVFGIAFLVLNIFLPASWFWYIYLLQMINLSGAAGDIYITFLMSRLPEDVLTTDEGVAMIIYSKTK